MAQRYNFRYSLLCFLFLVFFALVSAEYSPSFGFKKFDRNSKYFKSHISLVGDASVHENGSFVQISSGRVMFKKPIKLYEGNPRKKASFGTYFVFSVPPQNGDGLAFVVLRNGVFVKFAVEFSPKMDPVFGDLNDIQVSIKVGSSSKVMNVSDVKLKLESGVKLQCWIDFEASSKRVEVRVSKWGEERPINPSISHQIDLSSMFNNEEVFIALASSNANTTQIWKLYSWSFKLRQVPTWMHSQPLDPQGFKKDAEPVVTEMHKRSDCVLRLVTALVFGTGCGAMGAFIVLCAWSVFVTKKPVAPEEYVVQPVAVFDYEKVKVVVIDKSDCIRK
ncbi:hypothetical protein RND81_13G090700 [Saponaria officinalis]|uniref:Legume lectin domain-containing protein n=1 Tax=Saponaria officinalis TaxID=3572 RepID=A0AAW1H152_SAPOF